MEKYSNPFLIRFNEKDINFDDFNRILILTSNKEINLSNYINIDDKELKEISKDINLLESNIKILQNSIHKFNIKTINKIYLKYMNTDIKLNEIELIIPLFGIKESVLRMYLQQYNKNNLLNYTAIKNKLF